MAKVLILTGDVIGDKMAGPAIRAFEIARGLSDSHDVVLSCPSVADGYTFPESAGFELHVFGEEPSPADMELFDVVFTPGSMILDTRISKPLVVDLYDPFILSNLARSEQADSSQLDHFDAEFRVLMDKLFRGDYFLCASERQKDFWLGMLTAARRVNRVQFSAGHNLEPLIGIMPYGIPDTVPVAPEESPFPGADTNPDIPWAVWGGGIWDWFDPLTLIQAVSRLNERGVKLNLYFMGTRHPNPKVPVMARTAEAIALAKKLGMENKTVFFGDWVPYNQRDQYLTVAKVGVSTHFPHLETRFSYRTRILDYIWTRCPIVCTEGDAFGDLVQAENIGIAVPPEDVGTLEKALERLITDHAFADECRKNLDRIAPAFQWNTIVEPLNRFCSHAARSVDQKLMQDIMGDQHEIYLSGCESKSAAAGEIVLETGVTQVIAPGRSGLCRIDIRLATYVRKNYGRAYFTLEDVEDGSELVRMPFEMETVEDNLWRTFRFGPLQDKVKQYRIRVTAPGASSGNAVTLWVDRRVEGSFTYHGEDVTGSINYRAYASNSEQPRRPLSILARLIPRRFRR